MREELENCHCPSCGGEFTQTYPVAENRQEYQECRSKLAGGYIVNHSGQARRKIQCPNKQCQARVSVTILDQQR
jgi:hypothetical protein